MPARTARCLATDRRSVVTTEFAFVGLVFLLFVLMVVEAVLQLATQATLDSAAFQAARQIRIGNFTGSSYGSGLTSTVCGTVILIPACSSNIQIYVTAAASTGASGTSPPGTGFGSIATATASGGTMTTTKAALTANQDVILQVGYQRPFIAPLVGAVSGHSGLLLVATMAFQTEPY